MIPFFLKEKMPFAKLGGENFKKEFNLVNNFNIWQNLFFGMEGLLKVLYIVVIHAQNE